MSKAARAGTKIICQNRKARHEFHIDETYEAGLVLKGTEVKSLRDGQASLGEAFAVARGEELFIEQFYIPPYEKGNIHNVEPTRPRKLLLHKREIEKLIGAVSRKGYTLVPLSVYFKDGRAKVEIGVARGKKLYDKREDAKRKDQMREVGRALARDRRGD